MGYIRRRRLNQAKTKKRETAKSTKKIEENREKAEKNEKNRIKKNCTPYYFKFSSLFFGCKLINNKNMM